MTSLISRFESERVVPCLVLAGLAALPIIDFALPLFGVEPTGRRYSPTPLAFSWGALTDGALSERVEEYFQNRSFLVHGSGAEYNELAYRATGRMPGLKVSDDWVFLRSHLWEMEEEIVRKLVAENAEFVTQAKERFSQTGRELLVAVIPDRGRVYPEKAFENGEIPQNRNSFLPSSVEALVANGIPALDLTERLRQEVATGADPFFRVDHHWNYSGSERAAEYVAEWVRSQIDLEGGAPAREFDVTRSFVEETPHRSLVTLMKFSKGSDLESRFLQGQEIIRIAPAAEEAASTRERGDAAGVVLESSFGMFGFAQFLERSLGKRLDSIMEPGNGSVYAMARYLSVPPGEESHSFVLWVIPEYHLAEGLRNQGAGRTVSIPNPFSKEVLATSIRPKHTEFRGLEGGKRDWEVVDDFSRVRFTFAEPVEGLRLQFRCVGGTKRGQLFCPPSSNEGLLLFAGTPEMMTYDLRLEDPAREVEVGILLHEEGVSFEKWKVFGVKEVREGSGNPGER